MARDWGVRNDGLHSDADWVDLAGGVDDHGFRMAMAEGASRRSSYIAWWWSAEEVVAAVGVVVAAGNCATRPRRLAA
jgi:hypothetical protein